MKTNIILVLMAIVLSGCSYSRTTYNTQTEVINHNQQHDAFVRFVEFMNKNSTSKPTEALKNELNILLSEAELRRECTNKKRYRRDGCREPIQIRYLRYNYSEYIR